MMSKLRGCGPFSPFVPANIQNRTDSDPLCIASQAISLIKFPEYVKFTLALILHKYSTKSAVTPV